MSVAARPFGIRAAVSHPKRLRPGGIALAGRRYATVGDAISIGRTPSRPDAAGPTISGAPPDARRPFAERVSSELRRLGAVPNSSGTAPPPLQTLLDQCVERDGAVLDQALPYESRPDRERRVNFEEDGGVLMVAHGAGEDVSYGSGFMVDVPGMRDGEMALVTCAHTLEEIGHRWSLGSGPSRSSGSLAVSGSQETPLFHPVSTVLSAVRRSDLLVLSVTAGKHRLRTLPVSPYPVQPGARIRAHFVTERAPQSSEGWTPWVGGTWRKWVPGTVVGYRDFAGREAKPGTYDALSHLYFDPPPTPGSSGGPIVDEESGAVIGVVLGTQLVNRVEGVRGWGAPAEAIYEMFRLPGLRLKSRG